MKAGRLLVRWSRRENDLLISYPRNNDGALAHAYLCCERPRAWRLPGEDPFDPSFVDELRKRGYDITTLRFSVDRVKEADNGADTR